MTTLDTSFDQSASSFSFPQIPPNEEVTFEGGYEALNESPWESTLHKGAQVTESGVHRVSGDANSEGLYYQIFLSEKLQERCHTQMSNK